jgi:hypothetical protein
MRQRLEIGRSLLRLLSCLQPIGNSLLDQASGSIVVGQRLRFGLGDFGEVRFQR